jgi:hypothetical protein
MSTPRRPDYHPPDHTPPHPAPSTAPTQDGRSGTGGRRLVVCGHPSSADQPRKPSRRSPRSGRCRRCHRRGHRVFPRPPALLSTVAHRDGPTRSPPQTSTTNMRHGPGNRTPCSASKDHTASQPAGATSSEPNTKTSRREPNSADSQISVFMPVTTQDPKETAQRTAPAGLLHTGSTPRTSTSRRHRSTDPTCCSPSAQQRPPVTGRTRPDHGWYSYPLVGTLANLEVALAQAAGGEEVSVQVAGAETPDLQLRTDTLLPAPSSA